MIISGHSMFEATKPKRPRGRIPAYLQEHKGMVSGSGGWREITSFDQLQERIRARTSEPNDNVTMIMGTKIAVDDTEHRHVVALIDMEAVT